MKLSRSAIADWRWLPHVATAAVVVVFVLFFTMIRRSGDLAATPEWPFYAAAAIGFIAAIWGVILRSWPVFNAGVAIAVAPFAVSFVVVIAGLA